MNKETEGKREKSISSGLLRLDVEEDVRNSTEQRTGRKSQKLRGKERKGKVIQEEDEYAHKSIGGPRLGFVIND